MPTGIVTLEGFIMDEIFVCGFIAGVITALVMVGFLLPWDIGMQAKISKWLN